MSNWFQDHPTTSIIGHSIIVAGLTWAVSYFVLDESKVNLYLARAENAETVSAQYMAKVSALEDEISRLKTENERYISWLMSEPKSMPAMEKKIKSLEESLASKGSKSESSTPAQGGQQEPGKIRPLYEFSSPFLKGESFVDPKTKATLGVSDIASDYTARGVLYLPGGEVINIKDVRPGTAWTFDKGGVKYQMTLESVNWINNSLKASVTEIE